MSRTLLSTLLALVCLAQYVLAAPALKQVIPSYFNDYTSDKSSKIVTITFTEPGWLPADKTCSDVGVKLWDIPATVEECGEYFVAVTPVFDADKSGVELGDVAVSFGGADAFTMPKAFGYGTMPDVAVAAVPPVVFLPANKELDPPTVRLVYNKPLANPRRATGVVARRQLTKDAFEDFVLPVIGSDKYEIKVSLRNCKHACLGGAMTIYISDERTGVPAEQRDPREYGVPNALTVFPEPAFTDYPGLLVPYGVSTATVIKMGSPIPANVPLVVSVTPANPGAATLESAVVGAGGKTLTVNVTTPEGAENTYTVAVAPRLSYTTEPKAVVHPFDIVTFAIGGVRRGDMFPADDIPRASLRPGLRLRMPYEPYATVPADWRDRVVVTSSLASLELEVTELTSSYAVFNVKRVDASEAAWPAEELAEVSVDMYTDDRAAGPLPFLPLPRFLGIADPADVTPVFVTAISSGLRVIGDDANVTSTLTFTIDAGAAAANAPVKFVDGATVRDVVAGAEPNSYSVVLPNCPAADCAGDKQYELRNAADAAVGSIKLRGVEALRHKGMFITEFQYGDGTIWATFDNDTATAFRDYGLGLATADGKLNGCLVSLVKSTSSDDYDAKFSLVCKGCADEYAGINVVDAVGAPAGAGAGGVTYPAGGFVYTWNDNFTTGASDKKGGGGSGMWKVILVVVLVLVAVVIVVVGVKAYRKKKQAQYKESLINSSAPYNAV